jgi:hypothetical protein
LAFAAGHAAGVGFVIVSGEMEQAVEDEDLELTGERVTLLRSLAASGGNADSEVAGNFFGADGCGGKREYVRRLVLTSELPVELADCGIGGEQHAHLAAQAYRSLRLPKKELQCARPGQSFRPGQMSATPFGCRRNRPRPRHNACAPADGQLEEPFRRG